MDNKNDARIIELRENIKVKNEEISKIQMSPFKTNCIFNWHGNTLNLHVLSRDELVLLLIDVVGFTETARKLGYVSEEAIDHSLYINGYPIVDWIEDISNKINVLDAKRKAMELKEADKQLEKLLSSDKRTMFAIDNIEEKLKML